jgi:two-component system sensor histidine kinase DctS
LVPLVAALLATLVWLAGRHEASQVQSELDRDIAAAADDIRTGLVRRAQSLQVLSAAGPPPGARAPSGGREPNAVGDRGGKLSAAGPPPGATLAWSSQANQLLREHRELLRIEWRQDILQPTLSVDSPLRPPVFEWLSRSDTLADVQLACAQARRQSQPAYSASYYLPQTDGLGLEVMDLCLPHISGGTVTGYVVATYSLREILATLVGPQLTRSQEISFTEPDGTRLALHGTAQRGQRTFSSQLLLDLAGNTLVLRMNSWRSAPDLFPNVLTALVTAMSIALVAVLALLGKDTRRRVRVERDLADALAFRKAMENSLVTGLRARDLQGRITYVNPAFCVMVGFTADELLGKTGPAPYWPPELAADYQTRQEVRLAGQQAPPREGFESVFMHKDGTRFPVLIIEAPLINASGTQTGWMSAFLDIREQRRVEELSRATQERLQATARLATVGEMASLLSHELNQPLAAISSYATGSLNLLRDDDVQGLEVALQRIGQQAERAGRVIKSVHDFVRRRDQTREYVEPQRLFDAVLPLVNLQARKLEIRVITRVSVGLPGVLCDRTMVEQVLLNLARNAMQAMDEARPFRPSLTLEARHVTSADGTGAGVLAFSVADVGPGIAAEVQSRLFTPFFTTKREGMGLGLSLCRTVVEQHGGQLLFEPNLPQGTTFRFTLPLADPAITHAAARETSERLPTH